MFLFLGVSVSVDYLERYREEYKEHILEVHSDFCLSFANAFLQTSDSALLRNIPRESLKMSTSPSPEEFSNPRQ